MKTQYSREEKVAYYNNLLVNACERLKVANSAFEKLYWTRQIAYLAGIVERMLRKDIM